MSVRSKDEILSQLSGILGDNNSDEAISLIEDVSDSFDDFSTRINESGDWKNKYDELDKTWRDRYRDRFFNGASDVDDDFDGTGGQEDDKVEILNFEDLFTTK